MSKIQDAIRRLQTPASGSQNTTASQPKEDPSAKSRTIATLKLPDPSEIAEQGAESRPIVDVDFDLLRDNGLLAPTHQQRHIADQYRLIKRPLLDNVSGKTAHRSDDANLIMIASALAGDGKTFNCINLALSMATEKEKTVLLVDADVAKPHISTLFDIENEPGLIDLLTNPELNVEDVVIPTNVPGLQLLPAGRRDDHATELLASRRMAAMAEQLSKIYRNGVVLFDSPPLLLTSESRVLASRMGQIVVVVCSGLTPQGAVIEAIESLDDEKALSVVLNRSGKGFGEPNYGGYGYGYSAND